MLGKDCFPHGREKQTTFRERRGSTCYRVRLPNGYKDENLREKREEFGTRLFGNKGRVTPLSVRPNESLDPRHSSLLPSRSSPPSLCVSVPAPSPSPLQLRPESLPWPTRSVLQDPLRENKERNDPPVSLTMLYIYSTTRRDERHRTWKDTKGKSETYFMLEVWHSSSCPQRTMKRLVEYTEWTKVDDTPVNTVVSRTPSVTRGRVESRR